MKTRRSRNRVFNAAAWLTLAGLLALVVGTVPATAAQAGTCKERPDAGSADGGQGEPGEFFVRDKKFTVRFDELRTPQMRTITVDAYANPVAPKNVTASIDEDVVSNEGRSIGYGFTTGAEVVTIGNVGNPTTIRLCVMLDPNKIADLHPGKYEGVVVLRADNFKAAAIPLEATFRAPRSNGLKMASAGVVLGLLVKMLTELGSGRARPRGHLHAVREYTLQWSFPLAIILGVLTGWLGFVEMYETSETWGVPGTDSLKLFGTCFGFQMGSIGGADMTKRLVG